MEMEDKNNMLNKILNSSLFYTMIELATMWLGFYQIGYTGANPIAVTILCTTIIMCLYVISGEEICIGDPYKNAPVLKRFIFSYLKRQEDTENAYRFVNRYVTTDDWEDGNSEQIEEGNYTVVIVGIDEFSLSVGRADYRGGEWYIKSKDSPNRTRTVLCYNKSTIRQLKDEQNT